VEWIQCPTVNAPGSSAGTMSDSPSSGGCFDLDTRRVTLSTREAQMAEPKFWDVPDRAREVIHEVNTLKNWIEPFDRLEAKLREMTELDQLLETENDVGLSDELDRELATFEEQLTSFELRSMLQGPDDHRNAMVEISAGAGGTEAQDWAAMLLRMYTRWAERRGFSVEVLDVSEGEEAGIKGAMVEIRGQYAYGFLRSEAGVHRLVRISPFDSQSRRHTSFASVFVYPDVDEEINIEVRDEDIRMDVFRASGAGGQHVNKTSSAVRLTHIPSGIVTSCQQQRSQHKNKETALKMLKNALYQREVEERERKKAEIDSAKTDVSFGNQIRSYVFQPYTMVNDHRSELKITDVAKVMDGAIDPFIEAYLKRAGATGASAA
jgi:peptide chain release factor 2